MKKFKECSKLHKTFWRWTLIFSILVPTALAQFFGQTQFDCRRVHPRYCCTSRVRLACPQLCQQYPCNGPFPLERQFPTNQASQTMLPGLPGLPGLPNLSNLFPGLMPPNGGFPNIFGPPTGANGMPMQGGLFGNGNSQQGGNMGWSSGVGTNEGNRPPPNLILPPPDTAPSKGLSAEEQEKLPEFGRETKTENLPKPGSIPGLITSEAEKNNSPFLLPVIDPQTSQRPSDISSNTHPTLIPWNPTPNPPTQITNSNVKTEAMDGEIRNLGSSQPNTSSKKNLIIPPPNFKGFVDELEAIDKNGGEDAWPNGFPGFPGSESSVPVQPRMPGSQAASSAISGIPPPISSIPNGMPGSQTSLTQINPIGMPSIEPKAGLVTTATIAVPKSVQGRRPAPKIILPPPMPGTTGTLASNGETTEKKEPEPTDSIDESDQKPIDNVPPTPIHPETTWTPLKFNIHPARVPEGGRTTVSLPVPPPDVGTAPWSVQSSGYRSESNPNVQMERRGDLPLPETGIPDKMLVLNGYNQTNDNISVFGDRIDVAINDAFNSQTINALRNLLSKNNKLSPPYSVTRPSPSPSVLMQTTTASIPLMNLGQCGVAPEFRPCLAVAEASARLLNCCKQKLLPVGCFDLCRYDVTQAEIKKTFEAGRCGILNVAPFLECASQGKNNLDCCRHRNLAAKSGLQCETFCGAGKISALGIQHLACQNVIGDLISCHHSGLRP